MEKWSKRPFSLWLDMPFNLVVGQMGNLGRWSKEISKPKGILVDRSLRQDPIREKAAN